jgi:hypoxanthine phosphoribosyltransferase
MKQMVLFFFFATSFCCAEDHLELLVSPEQIVEKIQEAATLLDKEYQNEELTVVMVMKGAVCAASDLIRALHIPVHLEYIKASSYGKNGAVSGELRIKGIEDLEIEGKNILLVDDIFDSGKTMSALVEKFQELKPKSLKTLVVLVKDVPRSITYRPDIILFEIPNRFVVGYGLDYKEKYRNLPGIYAFINDTPPSIP